MVIMDTPESVGSLEEQAHKRKERLRNLKRKIPAGDNDAAVEIIVPLPKPKFRSYKPQDESLKEAKLDDAEPAAVEEEVKDLLEAGKEKNKGLPLKKEEVMLLLSLVENNPIVYTRTTNISSNKSKDLAWLKITDQFNSTINTHPRKPEQLRLKWENLKKNARKRYANLSINQVKTQYGIPDYIHPDEALDRVAAILGSTHEGYTRAFSGDGADSSVDETNELSTMVIPAPSDEEDIAGPIDCVEVGVGEACASGLGDVTNTSKDTLSDLRKRAFAHRTSGKSLQQNLMANEVESRIIRNNAIAEYYVAKKKKIDEEILLNRETLSLQKKKIELEMLELQRRGSKIDRDKLLLEKKQIELEILEIQRKKYSSAASLFRAASEAI